MDHSEALRLKAAERYLLGELTGVQQQEYEEHFFGCPECAQALGLGVVFIENTRDILGAEANPAIASASASVESARAAHAAGTASQARKAASASPGWFAALLRPAFAAPVLALLFAVVLYQGILVIPQLNRQLSRANAPQTLRTFSLLSQSSRGGTTLAVAVEPDHPFGFYFDIPPGLPYAAYSCDLQDSAGHSDASLKVSAADASQSILFLVPPNRLQPGQHVLVVRGLASSEGPAGPVVNRYSFDLSYLK